MKLSRINSLLLALIVVVNGYVIGAPFAPQVWFWWQSAHTNRAAELAQAIAGPTQATIQMPNSVIIPSMLLDQSIYEGQDTDKALNKGIWHWPDGSTPDKGGNTVLIGHRFTYTNSHGVFYFMDRVHIRDNIEVTWNDRRYIYRVADIRVVPPTDTTILDGTAVPTLTLYTCTSVWWSPDRLVVTAKLESTS